MLGSSTKRAARVATRCRAAFSGCGNKLVPVPALANGALNGQSPMGSTSVVQRQRQFCSAVPRLEANQMEPKVFVVVEVKQDGPGVLGDVLKLFTDKNINLTNIESRFTSFAREGPVFHLDFEGDPNDDMVGRLLRDVKALQGVHRVTVMQEREVPWFPLNIRDLDMTIDTLDGGTALINEDHPGFSDTVYKARRGDIVTNAKAYRYGDRIPRVIYNQQETDTWRAVYERLQVCHKDWACAEYNEMLPQMEKYCGFAPGNIPQLADISDFLQQRTGFTLRPIGGLLSARDFLNALAFRVFYSTQYIRHHGNPFYTPEPDICHELLGHVPLFANHEFADFSQEIGLASLAASDDDVNRLASIYWFTVEFGLLREGNDVKAFGAGLLSSFGEMEWSCSGEPTQTCRDMGSVSHLVRPNIVDLEPTQASKEPYPITTYQPTYFCADSLLDAKTKIHNFCETMARPFYPQYDPLTQNIRVTKAVRRAQRVSTVELQAQKQAAFFDKTNEEPVFDLHTESESSYTEQHPAL